MTTKKKKTKSWVDKKLSNKRFRDGFKEEYEKLSIGEQIARLRHGSGLTQKELATKIGTTASAISRYENAEYDRYELKTLRKIAEACGGALQLVLQPSRKPKKVA